MIQENHKNITIPQNVKDNIVQDIQVVIDGCCQDLHLSNSYASWKQSSKGLNNIKNDSKNFILGVKLWLQITLNNILEISNIDDLKILKDITKLSWLNNLINIIQIIN